MYGLYCGIATVGVFLPCPIPILTCGKQIAQGTVVGCFSSITNGKGVSKKFGSGLCMSTVTVEHLQIQRKQWGSVLPWSGSKLQSTSHDLRRTALPSEGNVHQPKDHETEIDDVPYLAKTMLCIHNSNSTRVVLDAYTSLSTWEVSECKTIERADVLLVDVW